MGLALLAFLILTFSASALAECMSCIYTNPATIEMEVWPVEKYTFEPLTFRVFNQQGPTKEPYPGYNIKLYHVSETGETLESSFLMTDAKGEAMFVPQYAGRYKVKLEDNDVYFAVKSRHQEEKSDEPESGTTVINITTDPTTDNDILDTEPIITEPPETSETDNTLHIWAIGCPHCAAEKYFLMN